jgi:AbrB family looped-hinge helix DNA binding protein
MTTTISEKGQLVIPKPIRQRRQINAGDDFEVLAPDGTDDIVLRKIQRPPNEGLADLLLRFPVKGFSVPARRKQFPRKPPKL